MTAAGCPSRERLDAWLDGEAPPEEAAAIEAHATGCASCASAALERRMLSEAVRVASRRFTAPRALRDRVASQVARRRSERFPRPAFYGLAALATAAALAVAASFVLTSLPRARREAALAELADVHATNLASERRVEVVSSDRHVVKPWFQGRLPFAVDVPEGDIAPFALLGGRVAFVRGAPAAQILFGRSLHVLSVFVVPEASPLAASIGGAASATMNGYGIRMVSCRGLVYVVVGDVSSEDLDRLSAILAGG